MDGTLDAVATVLIVEDEAEIADILENYLRKSGYKTERVTDGEQAVQLFRAAQPDLVLLDIMLPRRDGLEVLKAIRAQGTAPVIVLTARSEEVDKLVGLELGADDYIAKPFSPREVMARVKAVLRRSQQPTEPARLRVGAVTLDPAAMLAYVGEYRLPLTTTEYKLLQHLAAHPRRVFERRDLIAACLSESDALERVVDAHLKNLRRKLEAAGAAGMIETVRGVGYRLIG